MAAGHLFGLNMFIVFVLCVSNKLLGKFDLSYLLHVFRITHSELLEHHQINRPVSVQTQIITISLLLLPMYVTRHNSADSVPLSNLVYIQEVPLELLSVLLE